MTQASTAVWGSGRANTTANARGSYLPGGQFRILTPHRWTRSAPRGHPAIKKLGDGGAHRMKSEINESQWPCRIQHTHTRQIYARTQAHAHACIQAHTQQHTSGIPCIMSDSVEHKSLISLLEMLPSTKNMKTVCPAYSGGLPTSVFGANTLSAWNVIMC